MPLLALAVVSTTWAALVQAGPVAFCAPPEFREAVRAELFARGREPIDASELDEALFGPRGARARLAAGKAFELPPAVSRALADDFRVGLAGCRARGHVPDEARAACIEHLVDAVWERHLERVGPALVIEFKLVGRQEDGQLLVRYAAYAPGDATVSGGGLLGDSPAELVAAVVPRVLQGELPPCGRRPNLNVLPAKTPPPPPSLNQGAPQTLAALTVAASCRLPATLQVDPPTAPLAVTISALWRVSAEGHLDPEAPPLRCSLRLVGPPRHPKGLGFSCGGEVAELKLYASSAFGDAASQAAMARLLVATVAGALCDEAPAAP